MTNERPPANRTPVDPAPPTTQRHSGESSRVGIAWVVLVSFLLGVAAGAFGWHRWAGRGPASATGMAPVALSDGTEAVLRKLTAPVEIRYYALLDPAVASDSLRAFAARVDQLLSAYEQAAGGRITVVRRETPSQANADAAEADGIRPFNLDNGGACYLGFSITCNNRRTTLPQLDPQWEPAVESDLSRAIASVAAPKSPAPVVADNSPAATAATEAVKRVVPNYASVSVEEGTKILREAALKDSRAAAGEAQAKIKDAQQKLAEARNGGSEADQRAAMENVQRVQTEQMQKLQEIGARLQAEIAALERLKGIQPPAPTRKP